MTIQPIFHAFISFHNKIDLARAMSEMATFSFKKLHVYL